MTTHERTKESSQYLKPIPLRRIKVHAKTGMKNMHK